MSFGASIKMWLVVSFLKAGPRCSIALKGINFSQYLHHFVQSGCDSRLESSDTNRGDNIRLEQDEMTCMTGCCVSQATGDMVVVSIIVVNDGQKSQLWCHSQVNLQPFGYQVLFHLVLVTLVKYQKTRQRSQWPWTLTDDHQNLSCSYLRPSPSSFELIMAIGIKWRSKQTKTAVCTRTGQRTGKHNSSDSLRQSLVKDVDCFYSIFSFTCIIDRLLSERIRDWYKHQVTNKGLLELRIASAVLAPAVLSDQVTVILCDLSDDSGGGS